MTDNLLDQTKPSSTKPGTGDAHAGTSSGSHNLVADFLESAVYAGIQQPLNGLTQISDAVLGTHLLPKVQFMSAPERGSFGSGTWVADQVGGAVGMLLPFLVVGKGARSVLGEGAAAESGFARAGIGLSAREAALTGFTYGAFLQPSQYQEGSLSSFLGSRLANGGTSAATFTAMSLSGMGLSKFAGSSLVERSALLPLVRNDITIGALSGIPGGAVSSEINALRSGKPLPTLSDLGQSVASFSLVGGVFGASNQLFSARPTGESNYEYLSNKIQQRLLDMKDSAGRGLDQVGNVLFPNAGDGFGGLQPAFAIAGAGRFEVTRPLPTRIAESLSLNSQAEPQGKAIDSPGMQMSRGNDSNSGIDGTGASAAREKFDQLRQRAVIQKKDGQDYVFHEVRARLAQLKSKGQISPDWEVIPTEAGSPADKIGADYLLVNTRTEDVHMLDATSNLEKYENPQQHNVPVLREGGLIYFEPKWFDKMGSLRVDPDEPFDIQDGVRGFREDLNSQLRRLTETPSPFKLGEMPLPQITVAEPAQAKAQIDQYLAWVKQNIHEPNVDGYIATVRKSSTHLNITMNTVSQPEFNGRVQREADRAVLNWAIDKLLGRNTSQPSTSRNSDVYYHAKTGHVVLRAGDGSTVDSGALAEMLSASRSRLLSTDNLQQLLKGKQLEALKSKMPGSTDAQVLQRLSSIIVNNSNELLAGGRLGSGKPVIIDNLVSRLQSQPENVLLGKPQPNAQHGSGEALAAETVHGKNGKGRNGSDTANFSGSDNGLVIPNNVRMMAEFVGQAWNSEGFPPLAQAAHPDPIDVELILDSMIQDPARAPLKVGLEALLSAYKEGNPIAVQALEDALRGSGPPIKPPLRPIAGRGLNQPAP